jgi:CRP/FNR family transcriptional regulator, anaerobic regulatory protein
MSGTENHLQTSLEYISKYIGNIREEELEFLLPLVSFANYQKGDLIYKYGEVPKSASFIISGAVRSYYIDEEGKENTVGFHFENEPAFPYGSFVELVPAATSFVAIEPVSVVWVSRNDFYLFLETFPRFETGIAKILGEYLIKGGQHLKLMRIASSRERYKKLLELQPEIVTRVPLTYIASYLGMALETLSRVRAGKL